MSTCSLEGFQGAKGAGEEEGPVIVQQNARCTWKRMEIEKIAGEERRRISW
jgi:hypothetical protein